MTSIIKGLHSSQFHGLHLRHGLSALMTGSTCAKGSHEAHDGSDADALDCQLGVTFLQEVPTTDSNDKHGTDDP